jgi:hypothetical protein
LTSGIFFFSKKSFLGGNTSRCYQNINTKFMMVAFNSMVGKRSFKINGLLLTHFIIQRSYFTFLPYECGFGFLGRAMMDSCIHEAERQGNGYGSGPHQEIGYSSSSLNQHNEETLVYRYLRSFSYFGPIFYGLFRGNRGIRSVGQVEGLLVKVFAADIGETHFFSLGVGDISSPLHIQVPVLFLGRERVSLTKAIQLLY